ncbi:MAG: Smr/MutS family protein [Erysipelotrichaceae bacterium]|nr:Smr/MutS family protein [Erysipelotrichaceae bacterium]
MDNNYRCLDLHTVLKKISSLASIEEGKQYIENEEIDYNPLLIKKKNNEVKEALKLLREGFIVHFDGIYNVSDLFIKADKNICLSGLELKKTEVFHNHCTRIKAQFNKMNSDSLLRNYSDSINISESIFENVERCIDNSGEVKEDASDKLKLLYQQLSDCERDLYNRAHVFMDRHSASLQEPSIFTRNDRICFLIKNSDKNKYNGYTYGTSASGLASYVEPSSLIEANNRKLSLLGDISDEIERILHQLSYMVASVKEDYERNFESLVCLNVIFAKASYGYLNSGTIAQFVEGCNFDFTDLCHPLIDPNTVVSNNYRLIEPYKGIVISGSNTGGKTVSLKAIGLSVLMSYLGIPVICSEAKIPFYSHIYVDMDDNQSIADSLSTFSAHISNIDCILQQADKRSMILIDELISGTDPKEAQAISLAILEKIKEIGSTFIITTHFDDIKKYAYEDEEIMLSSVGFDMESLKPTYKYHEDSVGASNAIEIASRYFSDQNIIDNARKYLSINQSKQDEMIERLAKEIEETEAQKKKAQDIEDEFNKLRNEYDAKIISFEKEKQSLKDKYEKELVEYIEDIEAKALEKLESINESSKKEVIEEINNLADIPVKEEPVKEHVFTVGDNVRIKDNERVGVINAISKDVATISINGLTIKAKIKDLSLMPKTEKKKAKVTAQKYQRVSSELNLVGERVEDGVVLAEEYLDKANAAHMKSVKIIHGIGTGALRSAIRSRLKHLSYVKSFKDGDYYDGGSAVTIVEFKV